MYVDTGSRGEQQGGRESTNELKMCPFQIFLLPVTHMKNGQLLNPSSTTYSISQYESSCPAKRMDHTVVNMPYEEQKKKITAKVSTTSGFEPLRPKPYAFEAYPLTTLARCLSDRDV